MRHAIILRKSKHSTVVGYTNSRGVDEMKLTTAAFDKISGARVLGDLKPVSLYEEPLLPSSFYINFYDKLGAQRKLNKDSWIVTNASGAITDYPNQTVRVYFDEDEEGWYLTCDQVAKKYPMNEYPLDSGAGFLQMVGADHGDDPEDPEMGVQLTFSGKVSASDTPIRGVDEMMLTGNVSPRDRILGDFVPVSLYEEPLLPSSFYMNFYDSLGAQRKLNKDSWIVANAAGAITDYPNQTVRVYYDEDAEGWYLTCDQVAKKYPLNNYQVKSSDGFLMMVGADHGDDPEDPEMGVVLTIPSALD